MLSNELRQRLEEEAEICNLSIDDMLNILLSEALEVRSTERARSGYIYALIDPRDSAVRYVGKTKNKPSARLHQHITRPVNIEMRKWIDSLKSTGLRPILVILEQPLNSSLDERERYWMVVMAGRKEWLFNRFTVEMMIAWDNAK